MATIGNPQSPIGNGDTLVTSESPWPGLASFTEDASGFFFGREKETDELSRLVRRQTLTVLFGQSGLGKSSLLQAGLFPLLRDTDHLPLYLRLDHSPATPPLAEQVKSALTAAFAAAKAEAPAFSEGETLWEYFHRKDVDIWSAKNRLLTPVLAFDQFEEIFTLGRADNASSERSRVFLAELACLIENRAPVAVQEKLDRGVLDPAKFNFSKPSCQVILSLREDFLPDLEGLKRDMPALVHNRLRLKKLSGTAALEIVTKPAPHLLADGVAEKIVEFVAGARGGSAERLAELDVEPPLLSVICRELNDRRRALGQAQITADLVSGNRREILTDFYERSVADLPAEMRAFVEDHLLTKSGFRDNLALETTLESPGVTRPLLDTLVARRLLRIEERLGVHRVELTHDVLAEVVRGARDARQQRHTLALAARRARRQRWAITGLSLVVVALAIGAVFVVRSQRRAEQAQRDEASRSSRTDLSYGSQLLDGGKVAEGIAYLARAAKTDPTNYAAGPRLISALAYRSFAIPVGLTYSHREPVQVGAISADGSRLVTVTEDRKVHFWDVAAGREIVEPTQVDSEISAIAADSSGSHFAVTVAGGTLRIWEVRTGTLLAGPLPSGNNIFCLRFSPDGQWLATGNRPGEVKLWSSSSGKLEFTRSLPNPYWISAVDFSADGTKLLATDFNRGWQIWAVPTGKPLIPVMPRIGGQINMGRFTPDGKLVSITNQGVGAQLWDWASGKPVGRPAQNVGFAEPYFAPDGKSLLLVDGSRSARVWEVPSGVLRRKFEFAGLVGLTRDGRRLIGVYPDGSVHLADADDGHAIIEPLRSSFFVSARFSPDEKEIWTGSRDGSVRRWRVDAAAAVPLRITASERLGGTGGIVAPQTLIFGVNGPAGSQWEYRDFVTGQTLAPPFVLPERVSSLQHSADSRFAAVITLNDVNELWDLRHPPAVTRHPLQAKVSNTARLLFSEKGNRLGQYEFGVNAVYIWDTATGKLVGEPFHAVSGPSYLALDDNGARVAIGDIDGNITVFDVDTGKQLGDVLHRGTQISAGGFSPDGTKFASLGEGRVVYLTDVATGREVLPPVKLHAPANVFRFSQDGRMLTIPTRSNNEVNFWNLQTGALRVLQLSNDKLVAAFDFDRDDQRMAVRDFGDGRLQIWSMATGQLVAEPIMPQGQRLTTNFSPDGRFVLTYGLGTKTMEAWPIPPLITGTPVPGWLERLAAAVAGGRIGPTGEFVAAAVAAEDFAAIKAELAGLPDNAPYVKWGRWFLADPATRTISPESPLVAGEAAKFYGESPLGTLIALDQRYRRLENRVDAEIVERQIAELASSSSSADKAAASAGLLTIVDSLIDDARYRDAEPLARACLELREEISSATSANVANARSLLGQSIAGQKRFAEAEPILLRAYDEMKATGSVSRRIQDAARVLGELYAATNRPEKAAEWEAKVRPTPAAVK